MRRRALLLCLLAVASGLCLPTATAQARPPVASLVLKTPPAGFQEDREAGGGPLDVAAAAETIGVLPVGSRLLTRAGYAGGHERAFTNEKAGLVLFSAVLEFAEPTGSRDMLALLRKSALAPAATKEATRPVPIAIAGVPGAVAGAATLLEGGRTGVAFGGYATSHHVHVVILVSVAAEKAPVTVFKQAFMAHHRQNAALRPVSAAPPAPRVATPARRAADPEGVAYLIGRGIGYLLVLLAVVWTVDRVQRRVRGRRRPAPAVFATGFPMQPVQPHVAATEWPPAPPSGPASPAPPPGGWSPPGSSF